jgi:hypothetical protein
MYAAYLAEVNPEGERSVPDFGAFMKAWGDEALLILMLFNDGVPIGFQTVFKIKGAMLGQGDSYAFGACYTEKAYRTQYKMTISAGKGFADYLRSQGASSVVVGLQHSKATRLTRLSKAAVKEITRGFEV